MDPSKKPRVKPEAKHGLKEKVIVYSIKGIYKVKLDNHTFFPMGDARLDHLLNQNDVIYNLPSLNEASLIFRIDGQ